MCFWADKRAQKCIVRIQGGEGTGISLASHLDFHPNTNHNGNRERTTFHFNKWNNPKILKVLYALCAPSYNVLIRRAMHCSCVCMHVRVNVNMSMYFMCRIIQCTPSFLHKLKQQTQSKAQQQLNCTPPSAHERALGTVKRLMIAVCCYKSTFRLRLRDYRIGTNASINTY